MENLLFLFICFLFYSIASASSPSHEFLYPNFTASNFQYVEDKGTFLYSRNKTFKAAIFNPGKQQSNFYFCVIHVSSNAIIWSANRDSPISNSGRFNLTSNGITITDENGVSKWSTPLLQSLTYVLQLTEIGNLVLLDNLNGSLWESFQYPTDTIVIGQLLPHNMFLSSSVSDDDLSVGDYRFLIKDSDAILQWDEQTYWKLSMETKAYTNSIYVVDYMTINRTGMFLFGRNGSVVVIQVNLSPSDFRIAQLSSSGQFTLSSFSNGNWESEFLAPIDKCQIPFICGRVGLCNGGSTLSTPTCSCPPNFHAVSHNTSGCVPKQDSFYFQSSCNSTDSSVVSYSRLGYGFRYFSIDFSEPVKQSVNISVCQDMCTGDCFCLGVFYENSSGSCYVLENQLGSIILSNSVEDDMFGYIKTLVEDSSSSDGDTSLSDQQKDFPVIALVLLPFTGCSLLVIFCFLWWRRRILFKDHELKLHNGSSISSRELDAFYIPGLPKRFKYEELDEATDSFKTLIGSGGFGAVYLGKLADQTLIAVKKLMSIGIQGNKDFCAEIAIIGNIHHVNLVKLIGFCAQGTERLLVYEFMSRGSLDKTLFGSGPVLEFQERFDIALGTARGLAYLHGGCERKIIHCDVKPENILLHEQFQTKISDFGLSKFLSPEESSLFTTMRGTRGYLAPEWLTNSAISEKTDVYSFGMVLLELVSGRKNCSSRSRPQSHSLDQSSSQSSTSSGSGLVYFPLFALQMHEQGRYLELADVRLEGRVKSEDVERLVRIALCCVHEEPGLRPNMTNVVGMLESGVSVGQPRIESLSFLRFIGRGFTEASVIDEVESDQSVAILYPQGNTCASQHPCSSYVSSQQVSGPR